MRLVKYNPYTEFDRFREPFNRLFTDVFTRNREDSDTELTEWRPRFDIFETDDQLVFQAEIPGIPKEDVTVDVNDNILTIRGERKNGSGKKNGNYCRRERFYGKFQRSFALPENVNPESIRASQKNGVLDIYVPKPENKKPKRIQVKAE